jgi:hypothetical protein
LEISQQPDRAQLSQSFWIALALNFVFFLPILIADRYISEDLGRAGEGYTKWIDGGRPLSEFLMRLAALGTPFVDISPLPQLAALICYAAIPVVLARRFGFKNPLLLAMATFPLAANPYTLWNIARKFDSLPMALSILIMVLPVARGIPKTWKSWVLDIGILVCGLCFYQPSLNVYLVFIVFELIFHQRNDIDPADFLKLAVARLTSVVVALLLYSPISAMTVQGDYAKYAGELALGVKDIPLVVRNVYVDWNFLLNSFPREYRNLFVGAILVGLLLIIASQVRYFRRQLQLGRLSLKPATRIVVFVVGCSLPLAWVFASTGFLIFLRNFSPPTSYLFIGTGALFSTAMLLVLLELRTWKVDARLQVLLLAPFIYALMMFSSVYGNALKEQKQYEARIGSRLAVDLQKLESAQPFQLIVVDGNVGFAPIVEHVAKRFRLIHHVVEVQLAGGGNSGFFHEVLRYFGVFQPTVAVDSETGKEFDQGTTTPDVADPSYDLYRKNEKVFVIFKPLGQD